MKRLAELNIDELMSEFGKAGFQGEFTESLALMKLTIYLVSSGLGPKHSSLTYLLKIYGRWMFARLQKKHLKIFPVNRMHLCQNFYLQINIHL